MERHPGSQRLPGTFGERAGVGVSFLWCVHDDSEPIGDPNPPVAVAHDGIRFVSAVIRLNIKVLPDPVFAVHQTVVGCQPKPTCRIRCEVVDITATGAAK